MLRRLRAALVPPPRRDDRRLHRSLAARGAGRELVRYLEEWDADLDAAWSRCPRAAWLLELAARAGVEARLLHGPAAELLRRAAPLAGEARDQEPPDGALARPLATRVSLDTALYADAAEALEALRAQRVALPPAASDPLVDAMALAAGALVERDPEVREARAAVEEAIRWGRQRAFYDLSELYDALHAARHVELADAVRERLPTDAVRVALYGLDAHPYR